MSDRLRGLAELPEEVVTAISGGQTHVVATLDADGHPSTSLMTWVIAKDTHRLALCIDKRSRSYQNLLGSPHIAVEILADDLTIGVKGAARLVKEQMDSPPFPCALFVLEIEEVRDHGHPGTTFRGPSYFFHEDKKHRSDFEQRVYEELRSVD